MPPTLDQFFSTLNFEPDELPPDLPLCHLRDARFLEEIANRGQVPLWKCRVFNQDLLYLFYGGFFYRGKRDPTKDGTGLPVGLLFGPGVLSSIHRLYPFDTGAAHDKRYGADWNKKLAPFKRFEMGGSDRSRAAKVVHHFFGTNNEYLYGEPREVCEPGPGRCSELHDFYAADLTAHKVDQRYRRIEAQSNTPLPVTELLWIGYPEVVELQVQKLKQRLKLEGKNLECSPYKPFPPMAPTDAAAILQDRAQQTVINLYLNKPRTAA